MRRDDHNTRVVDLTDEQLVEEGILGDGTPEAVRNMVKNIRKRPNVYRIVSLSLLRTLKETEEENVVELPTYPARKNVSTAGEKPVDPNDFIVADGDVICKYERDNYYHGIAYPPSRLIYRTDLYSNPYPIPTGGTTGSVHLPIKKMEWTYGTLLIQVWDKVSPMIVALLKERDVGFNMIVTNRFSIQHQDGQKTLGPEVVWISANPRTTSSVAARDVSPDILHILDDHKVSDVVIEWYEGGGFKQL